MLELAALGTGVGIVGLLLILLIILILAGRF